MAELENKMRRSFTLTGCLEQLRSDTDSTRFAVGLGINGLREKKRLETIEEGIKIVRQQVRQIDIAARAGDLKRVL